MNAKKALFLDRDGVINKDGAYVGSREAFVFMPGVFPFLRQAADKGYRLVIITNQAGIARGYSTKQDYQLLTDWMLEQLFMEGISIDAVFHCPHHPVHGIEEYQVDCDCRKPKPGMLLKAAKNLNLDLASSALIGDKDSDVEAGRRAGVGKLLLLQGKYKTKSAPDVAEVTDFHQAVALL